MSFKNQKRERWEGNGKERGPQYLHIKFHLVNRFLVFKGQCKQRSIQWMGWLCQSWPSCQKHEPSRGWYLQLARCLQSSTNARRF